MSKTYNDSLLISRNKELISSEMDGETVMMNMHDGNYYGLNIIGTKIWEMIETPISLGDLINQLIIIFDVDEETCREDVVSFIAEMEDKKLVTLTR